MMSAYIISLPNCSEQLENLLVPLYQYPPGKEAFLIVYCKKYLILLDGLQNSARRTNGPSNNSQPACHLGYFYYFTPCQTSHVPGNYLSLHFSNNKHIIIANAYSTYHAGCWCHESHTLTFFDTLGDNYCYLHFYMQDAEKLGNGSR